MLLFNAFEKCLKPTQSLPHILKKYRKTIPLLSIHFRLNTPTLLRLLTKKGPVCYEAATHSIKNAVSCTNNSAQWLTIIIFFCCSSCCVFTHTLHHLHILRPSPCRPYFFYAHFIVSPITTIEALFKRNVARVHKIRRNTRALNRKSANIGKKKKCVCAGPNSVYTIYTPSEVQYIRIYGLLFWTHCNAYRNRFCAPTALKICNVTPVHGESSKFVPIITILYPALETENHKLHFVTSIKPI